MNEDDPLLEQEPVAEQPVEPQKPAEPKAEEKPAPKAQESPDVKSLIEQAVAPLRREADILKLGGKLGLTEEQAGLVFDLQQKHSIQDPEKALILARMEFQDRFPKTAQQRRSPGLLPPSGSSPQRSAPTPEPSYEDRIAAAKTPVERQQIAKDEFRTRIVRGMSRTYGIQIPLNQS